MARWTIQGQLYSYLFLDISHTIYWGQYGVIVSPRNYNHRQFWFICFCYWRFEGSLALPQVPEMLFADNLLRLEHAAGFGIEFNALDALKRVDAHNDLLKVAVSDAWREARFVGYLYDTFI